MPPLAPNWKQPDRQAEDSSAKKVRCQMKRAKARIITSGVPRLRRLYQEVIGLSPIGDDRYTDGNLVNFFTRLPAAAGA
jgi:hypothetical protein